MRTKTAFHYKHTIFACCLAYVAQAIVLNYIPLLYVTFQSEFGISLSTITMLTTVCFGVQLLVDLIAGKFVDKIGYRASMGIAHLTSALGLVLLAFLPELLPAPFCFTSATTLLTTSY